MFSFTKSGILKMRHYFAISTLVAFLCLSLAACVSSPAKQKEFTSPADAVQALVTALKSDNDQELLAVLGPEANELIYSGDEVADLARRQEFLEFYAEQNRIEPDGDKFQLVIGKNDWPFPLPLVKKGDKWVFDALSGKEEILDRRIGRNELNTIQVLLAIVDAQREYALQDHDGDGLPEYARQFHSDPGKKNGLYWEAREGEEPSPLGELVAKARAEGYGPEDEQQDATPYNGYYYRILTSQGGPNAADGAYDYIVDDKMIGGFAVVAYPAEYGNSGVMTFLVNHDGKVFQKDLGDDTETLAKAMQSYDPDASWEPAQ
jgi:hypothetical protein